MSFLRKKRVKFNVELIVLKLSDVPLLNAIIFAKVRLLDCGSFVGVTLHRRVNSHQVDFMSQPPSTLTQTKRLVNHQPKNSDDEMIIVTNKEEIDTEDSIDVKNGSITMGNGDAHTSRHLNREGLHSQEKNDNVHQKLEETDLMDETNQEEVVNNSQEEEKNPQPFEFQVRIPMDVGNSGELEECKCKISLRKEDRARRVPQKLGYIIINLSEFAASGSNGIAQNYLLEGYDSRQRQDNSRVHIHVRMRHQAPDPLFKVPTSSLLLMDSSIDADAVAAGPSFAQEDQDGTGSVISIESRSMASNLTTVVGAANRRLQNRREAAEDVQRTRRDAEDVIEEVLAETSAVKPTGSSSENSEHGDRPLEHSQHMPKVDSIT